MAVLIISNGDLYAFDQSRRGYYEADKIFTKINCDVKFAAVSWNRYNSIAVTMDGSLWGWGSNINGQLGLGDYRNRDTLTKIQSESKFIDVSSGNSATIAIDINGNLWYSGVGYGTISSVFTKIEISSNTCFSAVSCGDHHVLALYSEGNIWISGIIDKQSNKIRYDTTHSFWKVQNKNSFISISSGKSHSMAIDINGNLWGYGINSQYQLGTNNTRMLTCFTQIPCDFLSSQVCCGSYYTCVIDFEDTLWICGVISELECKSFTKSPFAIEIISVFCGEDNLIFVLDINYHILIYNLADNGLTTVPNLIAEKLPNLHNVKIKPQKSARNII